MLKDIKGAIFDMDGTLIDSMWIWTKINIDFLKKRNIECPENIKEKIQDLCFEDAALYFKNTFNLKESAKEICDEWNNMALDEYKHNAKLKPGTRKFLNLLKSMGIKIGLATSNCELLLTTALKANGIYDYFHCITRTDEVTRGKNFPDVYLLTANRIGINPSECVVFEDIFPAVVGAKAAGMKVIGIYDDFSSYEKDKILTVADKYIYDYSDLIDDVI
ncbi:HAD family hydrolase [Clostridium haemolyticum]|uniref:HAD family hydrolase n=1 Tax=Clostridium haemolyticum NCTC 9693 TaxID=1443114 RepID=A0ABR4TDD0_CLOHA|nr:HAD family phosphatase [Clostridium haemolyticum]KEI15391.1 HAD family hydrolase [Clostridium haemolyticum NCTC 9693]KGN04058.1 HAD family hydrolase [Clostridium haemolyticum NCTC 8350]